MYDASRRFLDHDSCQMLVGARMCHPTVRPYACKLCCCRSSWGQSPDGRMTSHVEWSPVSVLVVEKGVSGLMTNTLTLSRLSSRWFLVLLSSRRAPRTSTRAFQGAVCKWFRACAAKAIPLVGRLQFSAGAASCNYLGQGATPSGTGEFVVD